MQTVTESVFSFEAVDTQSDAAAAIVVAAGSSRRMQGEDKIFAGLCGVPVIIRTLRVFEQAPEISKIILVARKENILRLQQLADNYLITKLTDIVPGGAERTESVKNGLSRLTENDEYVLIHDGARPLVSKSIISDVFKAAKIHGAAACAVDLKDTIKEVDNGGFVLKTPNRSSYKAVQTPQGFNVSLYRSSIPEDCSGYTDDCSIVEAAGHRVFLTKGSYKNIKITTPEDLLIAQAILQSGEENV